MKKRGKYSKLLTMRKATRRLREAQAHRFQYVVREGEPLLRPFVGRSIYACDLRRIANEVKGMGVSSLLQEKTGLVRHFSELLGIPRKELAIVELDNEEDRLDFVVQFGLHLGAAGGTLCKCPKVGGFVPVRVTDFPTLERWVKNYLRIQVFEFHLPGHVLGPRGGTWSSLPMVLIDNERRRGGRYCRGGREARGGS